VLYLVSTSSFQDDCQVAGNTFYWLIKQWTKTILLLLLLLLQAAARGLGEHGLKRHRTEGAAAGRQSTDR
jgi:hypothetical protein